MCSIGGAVSGINRFSFAAWLYDLLLFSGIVLDTVLDTLFGSTVWGETILDRFLLVLVTCGTDAGAGVRVELEMIGWVTCLEGVDGRAGVLSGGTACGPVSAVLFCVAGCCIISLILPVDSLSVSISVKELYGIREEVSGLLRLVYGFIACS